MARLVRVNTAEVDAAESDARLEVLERRRLIREGRRAGGHVSRISPARGRWRCGRSGGGRARSAAWRPA